MKESLTSCHRNN